MTQSQASTARVYLDTNRLIGEISPLLFGGFAEHMGRCIYGGIYEPASPRADARGFRRDVLGALRDLNFSVIRYPGGNFLSGYHWRDGVGPREQRPRRRELAWHSIETNQFGANEFVTFCREIGAAPMLGVNMGTGSIEEASSLVEYCNAPRGTELADLRAAHGFPEPHKVQHWCLGNEMDGPWQIGHLEANEYAVKARETAKLMRWHDPNLKLTLCGSSGDGMPTFPDWDRTALEACWEHVDFHSMHFYANNRQNDTASYLAMSAQFERFVDSLSAVLRYVKTKLRSKHEVYLSWDEWNVWYKNMIVDGQWAEAPRLIEEVYNLEDALVVAQWLNVFMRRCDVLKMACLAQIVNVIAPILTETDALLKQTTYYPFMLFRRFAAGSSLDALVTSPHYATAQFGEMPLLDVSATHDAARNAGAVFLVNRSQTDALPVEIIWQNSAPGSVTALYQLTGTDPKAANTFEHPDLIVPRQLSAVPVIDKRITLQLPPLSFTALEVRF
jgi:alpha-N-arabinofuranosidase